MSTALAEASAPDAEPRPSLYAAPQDEVVRWMRTRTSHAFTQIRNDGSDCEKELKSLELAAYGTLMSGEPD